MDKNEIDIAMDRIFDGAERVRATKYQNRSKQISGRIISEILEEEKINLKVA